jgi:hypothetical protein
MEARGQRAADIAQSWVLSSMRQAMLMAVTPLRRTDNGPIEGTGFFFASDAKLFLITCYHVVFPRIPGQPEVWNATVHLSGGASARPGVVLKHPAYIHFRVPEDIRYSPSGDLCAVEVQGNLKSEDHFYRALSPERLAQAETRFWQELMDIGLGVFMAGYPPLVRSGSVAFDPSLGWDGDDSLGVANLAAYEGDSGAPIFWQGPGLVLDHHTRSAVQVEDLKLIGVHCGGYYGRKQGEHGPPMAFSVYAKASLLRTISEWIPMASLAPTFAHPKRSVSHHVLHKSGFFEITDTVCEPLALDLPKQSASHHVLHKSGLVETMETVGEPLALDTLLNARLQGASVLIEKNVGQRWTICFDDRGVLQNLAVGRRCFERRVGRKASRVLDSWLCFYCDTKAGTSQLLDVVIVIHAYPSGRKDGVVASGLYFEGLDPSDSIPETDTTIAWRLGAAE